MNDNEVFKTIEDILEAFIGDFNHLADIRWGEYRNIYVDDSYQSEGNNAETLFVMR